MICIDGEDEWHGRHQDCVQGQPYFETANSRSIWSWSWSCALSMVWKLRFQNDLQQNFEDIAISSLWSTSCPTKPSDLTSQEVAEEPSCLLFYHKKLSISHCFQLCNFLALKLSHHWFQKHLAWRVFISRRGKLQLWQKSLEVTVTKCQRSCWLWTSEGVSHWPNHKSPSCPKNAPKKKWLWWENPKTKGALSVSEDLSPAVRRRWEEAALH